MTKQGKRIEASRALIKDKVYALHEALELLKSLPAAKFVESVEVVLRLGIDPKKSDQNVRGVVLLPHGTGRSSRVAVFAEEPLAALARAAGADVVGLTDLLERIQAGDCPFDVVIAQPQYMALIGKLGPILGPRGLMPNPKLGTVTTEVEKAVREAKAGQVRYRNDKQGLIHAAIGKLNFSAEALAENLRALMAAVKKAKPPATKGQYLRSMHLSTTMGPGVSVSLAGEA